MRISPLCLLGAIAAVAFDYPGGAAADKVFGTLRRSSGAGGGRQLGGDVERSLQKRIRNCRCPEACTEEVLNAVAPGGTQTCLERMEELRDLLGYSAIGACRKVAHLLPDECGGCDPDQEICIGEYRPECDRDGDGYMARNNKFDCSWGNDCNDKDPTIHPGAKEVCGEGKDNDCDGIAEGFCGDGLEGTGCAGTCRSGSTLAGDGCEFAADCGGVCSEYTVTEDRKGNPTGAFPGSPCVTDADCPPNRGNAAKKGYCMLDADACEVTCPPTTSAPVPSPTTSAPVPTPVTDAPVPAPVTDAPVPAPTTSAPVPAPTTSAPVPAPTTEAPVPAPTTSAPVPAPTTSAPVPAPTTEAPVPAPTTSAPIPAPTTDAPVPAPTTSAPVPAPTTEAPVPAPTTSAPVPAPTTEAPVPAPTTSAPVPAPTTEAPVPAPTTSAPVPAPTTEAPVPPPTTEAPVPAPTTEAPVPAPTTSAPVPAPTTSAPVPAPTTSAPVPAPTTEAPVPAPTTSAPVPAPTTSAPVPAPAFCDSNPCQNGGTCVAATSSCDCVGTGYTGETCTGQRASFMEGEWGLGFRIQGGNWYEGDAGNIFPGVDQPFPAERLRDQITTNFPIPPSWIVFGLSAGADGLEYTAPHPDLTECHDYVAGGAIARNATLCQTPSGNKTSDFNNFYQLASWFKASTDIKVIVYMATEGPAKLHHCSAYGAVKCDDAFDWNETAFKSPAMEAWLAKVASPEWQSEMGYETNVTHLYEAYRGWDDLSQPTAYFEYNAVALDILHKAYAEKVVKYFATEYTDLIDGYWFDHATDYACNRQYIVDAIRSVGGHQADVPIAFQHSDKVPLANKHPGQEDYTGGHPNPLRADPPTPPYSCTNEPMVGSIEGTPDGYFDVGGSKSLGHMFLPTNKDSWNRLLQLPGWDSQLRKDRAVEWMYRVKTGGGALTWNSPMASNNINNRVPESVDSKPSTTCETDPPERPCVPDGGAWGIIEETHIEFLQNITGRLYDVINGDEILPDGNNCDIPSAAPTFAPTESNCNNANATCWESEISDGNFRNCGNDYWKNGGTPRCCRFDLAITYANNTCTGEVQHVSEACCALCSEVTCP